MLTLASRLFFVALRNRSEDSNVLVPLADLGLGLVWLSSSGHVEQDGHWHRCLAPGLASAFELMALEALVWRFRRWPWPWLWLWHP